jgi:CheY-specific phosphatase CheX
MTEINSLDLKEFITNAVSDVFDTMLSMEVETVTTNQPESPNGTHIVGTVSFGGVVMGNLNMRVGNEFARQMTAAMLGMDTDEIDGDEEVHDVIGEVCNMIGGDLKSRLCDSGLTCELSIPSITSGKEFSIQSRGWDRSELYAFRNQQQTAVVQVFIKSGN